MTEPTVLPAKADNNDFLGRFREIVSDPLNLLIERVPLAGTLHGSEVYLHNGNLVPMVGPGSYYGVFSQVLIINRGVHEPLEEYVFQELLRILPEMPSMIELGAYWAHYSMWLKKARPQATCIMVEPDPGNLAAGRANFERNGYQGEFIEATVAKGHWELDRFVQSRGLAHLTILHVDIEGFEAQLIDGGRDTLGKAMVDYIFVSTHAQTLHNDTIKALSGFGYRVEAASDFENDTTSYEGLVFVSSPNVKPVFKDFAPLGRARIAASSADELVRALVALRHGGR